MSQSGTERAYTRRRDILRDSLGALALVADFGYAHERFGIYVHIELSLEGKSSAIETGLSGQGAHYENLLHGVDPVAVVRDVYEPVEHGIVD